MDNLTLQLQDSGVWRDMGSIQNNSQRIIMEMQQLKNRYPDKRVRVVDGSGRLIDMLP